MFKNNENGLYLCTSSANSKDEKYDIDVYE